MTSATSREYHFDPPGCGSGMRVPALPEPCCHHGAQGGRLPFSLSGFPAVPPRRLSMLLYQFDRQVIFSPAFLPGRGWQTPQLFWTRKDTERGCAFCVQSFFSCLSKFSVIQFSRVIRLKETLCGANGYSSPYVHIQHTEKLGSQLSKSHRRENHL